MPRLRVHHMSAGYRHAQRSPPATCLRAAPPPPYPAPAQRTCHLIHVHCAFICAMTHVTTATMLRCLRCVYVQRRRGILPCHSMLSAHAARDKQERHSFAAAPPRLRIARFARLSPPFSRRIYARAMLRSMVARVMFTARMKYSCRRRAQQLRSDAQRHVYMFDEHAAMRGRARDDVLNSARSCRAPTPCMVTTRRNIVANAAIIVYVAFMFGDSNGNQPCKWNVCGNGELCVCGRVWGGYGDGKKKDRERT